MAVADLISRSPALVLDPFDDVQASIEDMRMLLASYRDLTSPDGGDVSPAWLYVVQASFNRLDAACSRLEPGREVRS